MRASYPHLSAVRLLVLILARVGCGSETSEQQRTQQSADGLQVREHAPAINALGLHIFAVMTMLQLACRCLNCAQVPHFSQCSFCHTCLLTQQHQQQQQQQHEEGAASFSSHATGAAQPASTASNYPSIPDTDSTFRVTQFLEPSAPDKQLLLARGLPPSLIELAEKLTGLRHPRQQQQQQHAGSSHLSAPPSVNCSVCYGCTTQLEYLGNMTFQGRRFKHDSGASATWTFRASSNRTTDREAVVKLYCLPLLKGKHGEASLPVPTSQKQEAVEQPGGLGQGQGQQRRRARPGAAHCDLTTTARKVRAPLTAALKSSQAGSLLSLTPTPPLVQPC